MIPEITYDEKISLLRSHNIDRLWIDQYVKDLTEEEFYYFLHGLTDNNKIEEEQSNG